MARSRSHTVLLWREWVAIETQPWRVWLRRKLTAGEPWNIWRLREVSRSALDREGFVPYHVTELPPGFPPFEDWVLVRLQKREARVHLPHCADPFHWLTVHAAFGLSRLIVPHQTWRGMAKLEREGEQGDRKWQVWVVRAPDAPVKRRET